MNEASLKTDIAHVVVYSTGARVTRQGVFARNGAWPATLRISGLPLCAEDGSLKARILPDNESASEATLPIATGVRAALEVPESNEGLRVARDPEVLEAQRKVDRLELRLKTIQLQLQRISAMKWAERPRHRQGEPPPLAPVQARLDALKLLREESDALVEERCTTERELKRVQERMESLCEAAHLKTSAVATRTDELRKSALITLRPPEGAGPETVRVELEYLVPGARWSPSYTLRFAADFSHATMEMRAAVIQQTGEDWKETRLTLSTALPMRWTDLPELNSLRIGRTQAAPQKKGWREAPKDSWTLFRDYDKALGTPAEQKLRRQRESEDRLKHLAKHSIHQTAYAYLLGGAAGGGTTVAARGTHQQELRDVGAGAAATTKETIVVRSPPPPAPVAMAAAAFPAAAMITRRAQVRALGTGEMEAPTDLTELGAGFGRRQEEDAIETHGSEPPVVRKEMLDYGHLRMPPPDDEDRGSLKPMTRMEDLLLLAHQKLSLTFHAELEQTILLSTKTAHAGNESEPDHCAKSVDGFDYAYVAESLATLPSDGQFHSMPVRSMNVPINMQFVAVPRIAPKVYRFAEFVNPLADAPVLMGPADLWCGEDFLMSAQLATVPPGGLVKMGMGVEQGLKTARNVHYEEEAAGLLGGSLNLRHHIKIELKNNLSRAAVIEVRERLPVTREKEEEIKVETGNVTPAWDVLKDEVDESGELLKGGRFWRVSVEPGAVKVLEAAYTIQISSKHELDGGNRREGS